ncbi:hypothetical protein, partial [Actinomyces urogenitalis]|uniref:hypothetical protein n=1 Tax=Actinomyces urogenitalis TaxID=103621 RepID=UPI001C60D9B1
QGRQTKTKQEQPTPKNQGQPSHYGIKNMTHYRVLKQHTHEVFPEGLWPFVPPLKATGLE